MTLEQAILQDQPIGYWLTLTAVKKVGADPIFYVDNKRVG